MCVTERDLLLNANHSLRSTYFGNSTIVLKLPRTSILFTWGLDKYKGFVEEDAEKEPWWLLVGVRDDEEDDPADLCCLEEVLLFPFLPKLVYIIRNNFKLFAKQLLAELPKSKEIHRCQSNEVCARCL